jgi:hypothetical protein
MPRTLRDPRFPDLLREHWAQPVPPKPDGLVANVGPPFGQKILDVPQWQWISHTRDNDQANHFWRTVEISEWVAHGSKLPHLEAVPKISLIPSR